MEAAPPFVSLLSLPDALQPGRTAVLGCGRGYDALLFAEDFEVVGFDFAAGAIAQAKALAQTTGSTAGFHQRDISDLDSGFHSAFNSVVENTYFCAIAPAQRLAYSHLVHSILRPSAELMGLFWAHPRPGGPPFGVIPAEIHQCFASDFEISLTPVTNSVPERQGEEYLGRFRRRSQTGEDF